MDNKYTADEYNPNKGRAYNQWTRSHDDTCEYAKQLNIGGKPMKYYINQYNSPQVRPYMEYTSVGNKKVYNNQNEYEYPVPSRLNPLPQMHVLPYSTSPNLGSTNPSMNHSDAESILRTGADLRSKKSAVASSEIDYTRWEFVDAHTVQNAGQFGSFQAGARGGIDKEALEYAQQNNVIFANGAWPNGGVSSRNQMHNLMDTSNC